MTIDEVLALAQDVKADKSRSYVGAAKKLAEFVIAALGTDALHPNGRCMCCGEGRCVWCRRTGYGEPAEPLHDITAAGHKACVACSFCVNGETCVGCELRALREVAKAARAYIDSEDQDRVAEFDAMEAALDALPGAKLKGSAER